MTNHARTAGRPRLNRAVLVLGAATAILATSIPPGAALPSTTVATAGSVSGTDAVIPPRGSPGKATSANTGDGKGP